MCLMKFLLDNRWYINNPLIDSILSFSHIDIKYLAFCRIRKSCHRFLGLVGFIGLFVVQF